MIGRTLGNFRIVEQIGVGGMATVYKAYDPGTDRYVAVKVLPQHMSRNPQFRKRFEREARAIANLEHIHILPVFAFGEEGDVAYLAMRYLQAGTLTDRIAQGMLTLSETGRLLSQIAGALDYAHGRGVLHRDVKPSNVLLDASGNTYLTDFGIAKMVEATVDLTGDAILGTPAYMSPEQCQGAKQLSAATDIYSLGIVLYEMVTGRRPFDAETPLAVIYQHLHDPLPRPRALRPDLPEAVEAVIFKALAKEPEARFRTAGELAAAFSRAIAGVEELAPPVVSRTLPAEAAPAVPATQVAPEAKPAAATQVKPAPAPALSATAAVPMPARPEKKRRLPGWALGLVGLGTVAIAVVAVVTAGDKSIPKSSGTFALSDQELGAGASYAAALADLDGDGDLDAWLGSEVWLNDGTGRFAPAGQVPEQPEQGALGDLDGDGDLDLFAVKPFGAPGWVWLNDGAGRLGDSGRQLPSENAWAVALGDADGDGDLDAYVGNWGEDQLWLNDGAAGFTDSGQRLGSTAARAAAFSDLDGDRDLDIVVAGDPTCQVWLNDGWGTFRLKSPELRTTNAVSLALGDLDGDGDTDAFVGGGSGDPDQVWLNDGAAGFTDSGQRLGDDFSEGVALADLDGDGDLDVFVASDTGPNRVWLNDGAGRFSDSGRRLGNGGSTGLSLGDVDGDGDLDALVGNTGNNALWLNQ